MAYQIHSERIDKANPVKMFFAASKMILLRLVAYRTLAEVDKFYFSWHSWIWHSAFVRAGIIWFDVIEYDVWLIYLLASWRLVPVACHPE